MRGQSRVLILAMLLGAVAVQPAQAQETWQQAYRASARAVEGGDTKAALRMAREAASMYLIMERPVKPDAYVHLVLTAADLAQQVGRTGVALADIRYALGKLDGDDRANWAAKAYLYRAMGDLQVGADGPAARDAYVSYLSASQQAYGQTDPRVAMAYLSLVELELRLNDVATARQYQQQAEAIVRPALGWSDITRVRVELLGARVDTASGKVVAAEQRYNQLLDVKRPADGEAAVLWQAAGQDYLALLRQQGRVAEADALAARLSAGGML
ncbi:hypothetical protein [Parapedomonas caeni]